MENVLKIEVPINFLGGKYLKLKPIGSNKNYKENCPICFLERALIEPMVFKEEYFYWFR